MKSVIHGLVLPYELPENQRMLKQRLKNFKYYQKRHVSVTLSSSFQLINTRVRGNCFLWRVHVVEYLGNWKSV